METINNVKRLSAAPRVSSNVDRYAQLRRITNTVSQVLGAPLLILVLIYQKTLSPDHGLLKPWYPYGYCKFYPSCSEYAGIVLRTNGILGIPKIIKRLISCRPGVAPAIDKP